MKNAELDQYWVTIEDPEELAKQIRDRILEFHSELDRVGVTGLLNRCYSAYYGGDLSSTSPNGTSLFESSYLKADGQKGQLTKYKVNHARNAITHVLNLISAKKIKFAPRAVNTDAKSQYQTLLAKGVVEYYWRDKTLQPLIRKAAEISLTQLESWVHDPFDTGIGKKEFDPETGTEAPEGDITFSVHPMQDVIRPVDVTDSKWRILKEKVNKWDLIALYPELKDKLLTDAKVFSELDTAYDKYSWGMVGYGFGGSAFASTDFVTKWTLYHAPTPAVPDGKLIVMVGDHILYNVPLPYRRIPLHPLRQSELLGTGLSYSIMVDMLGPQQANDLLNSSIMTNQAALGMSILWTRRNDAIEHGALADGLSFIQSDEPPQPLNLANSPAELFKNRDQTRSDIEQMGGINGSVKGEPPVQASSGTSQALMISQAAQFSAPLEEAIDTLAENLATDIIHYTQDFVRTKKIASIIGDSKRPFMREYGPDDLSGIDRVVAEKVNPLSQTIAGRLEIAQTAMQHGTVNVEQYLQILETGNLEVAMEGTAHQQINMKAENERLRAGGTVPVIISDNHPKHIQAHFDIIAAPEDRENPDVVNAVLAHVQEHLTLWSQMPPDLLQILNIPPSAQAQMSQQPPNTQPAQEVTDPAAQEPESPPLPTNPELPANAPPQAQAAYEQLKG